MNNKLFLILKKELKIELYLIRFMHIAMPVNINPKIEMFIEQSFNIRVFV